MLPEIIAIIYLSKNVREVAKEKGLNPTPYIAIAVVMLICLEIVGFIVGFIVVGNGWAIYPFALIGAGVGAYVGYSFVKSAIPKSHQ